MVLTNNIKRNCCNLELRLVPSNIVEEIRRSQQNDEKQSLTIFYNGSVSVADVTELQARALLLLASREVEERIRSPTTTASEPATPSALPSPLYSSGLSMKKSLQRFLQKTKNRSQAASPYSRHH
uniref:Protein TIFY n=1 Tax=Aquilaria sinensis TaxID=210372 RepID=A0AA94YE67_9ROSI|nr:JAZ4 [Aquilaria sinensis]UXP70618.1 JAZ4 [Aquilaria sinensis]